MDNNKCPSPLVAPGSVQEYPSAGSAVHRTIPTLPPRKIVKTHPSSSSSLVSRATLQHLSTCQHMDLNSNTRPTHQHSPKKTRSPYIRHKRHKIALKGNNKPPEQLRPTQRQKNANKPPSSQKEVSMPKKKSTSTPAKGQQPLTPRTKTLILNPHTKTPPQKDVIPASALSFSATRKVMMVWGPSLV